LCETPTTVVEPPGAALVGVVVAGSVAVGVVGVGVVEPWGAVVVGTLVVGVAVVGVVPGATVPGWAPFEGAVVVVAVGVVADVAAAPCMRADAGTDNAGAELVADAAGGGADAIDANAHAIASARGRWLAWRVIPQSC
jgi:hypothetical protein